MSTEEQQQPQKSMFERAKDAVAETYNVAAHKLSEGIEMAKEGFEGSSGQTDEQMEEARNRISHGYEHVSHQPVNDKTEEGKEMAGRAYFVAEHEHHDADADEANKHID